MALTQAFTAPKLTSDIVSLSDYIHKPQIRAKLFPTYNDQYNVEMLVKMGLFKTNVKGNVYSWQEDDLFCNAPVIASVVDNTGSITVTYAASSHTDSGKKSYGKFGETVQFANYLGGRIQSKSVAVDGAHTITVTPLGTSASGAAITSAQLIVGLVAGQSIGVEANAFAHGGVGQTQSTISTISSFQNQLQYLSEDFTVNFDEMNHETWVEFPYVNADGEEKKRYYQKQVHDTEKRFLRSLMFAAILSKGGSTVDENNATVPATVGLYTAMERYSPGLQWSGTTIGIDYFNQMALLATKTFVSEGYTGWTGQLAAQALEELKRSYKVNRPDLVGSTIIDSRLTEIMINDLSFTFAPMGILNDPFTTNVIGNKYKKSIMWVPKGTVRLKDGEETEYFGIRYYPRANARGGEAYIAFRTLGFNGEVATNTQDVKQYHWKATMGSEWHGLRQMVLSSAQ